MKKLLTLLSVFLLPMLTFASEADLVIPSDIKNQNILYWGFLIIFFGLLFGLYQFVQVKKLKAHKSMLDVAQVIYETCKTYLKQQGRG
jgi:K(+)-stimulated pyrophosphate-energized sodium pump